MALFDPYSNPKNDFQSWFNQNLAVAPSTSSTASSTTPSVYSPTTDPVYQSLQKQLSDLSAQISASSTVSPLSYQPITIDPTKYQVAGLSTFLDSVMKDPKFTKYYDNLLSNAQGDVGKAKQRLEEDYATGVRKTTKQLEFETQRSTEDFQSSLKKLTGTDFPKEQEGLIDALNKRGIALSKTARGGPIGVASEGQAGVEMARLSEDQRLRKEALERNQKRSLQDIGLKKEESLGDTSKGIEGEFARTRRRGAEEADIGLRKTMEQMSQEKEQKAYNIASIQQQQEIAQKQMQQQQEIAQKQAQLQADIASKTGAGGVSVPTISAPKIGG